VLETEAIRVKKSDARPAFVLVAPLNHDVSIKTSNINPANVIFLRDSFYRIVFALTVGELSMQFSTNP
jgi:hypothetical protein